MAPKLELSDIVDLRAYERERPELQERVLALKRRRRVSVGPVITLVFENRDTVRFQIQEMARAERILTDEGIQAELDIYNPLIPDEGSLSATLFIELTSKDELMEWLPKLVGIERAVQLRIDDEVVAATPDAEHERQLTRETITASVHYVHFDLGPEQIQRFADARVRIEVAHENYAYETELSKPAKESLLSDLCG